MRNPRTVLSARSISSWFSLLLAFVPACGADDQRVITIQEDTAKTEALLLNYAPVFDKFTSSPVPVCWKTANWAREKTVVQQAVAATWSRVANIDFTSWSDCPATGNYVRLEIQNNPTPGAEDASTGLSGQRAYTPPGGTSAMVFLLSVNPPGEDRIRYLAVHEFGHLLGFQHEDDHPERNDGATCAAASSSPWTNLKALGPYDDKSVMQAQCNFYGNGMGYLSAGDVAAVRLLYGARLARVAGDYDGDGVTDMGIWRPSTGQWMFPYHSFIFPGQGASTVWGQSGDVPVPSDYNGDGKTEIAVWRPSTGAWWIPGVPSMVFGQAGDIPVPGDYAYGPESEIGIYRPSTGDWWIYGLPAVSWGIAGDVPVPADYDGDGKLDMAVYRPSTGQWLVNRGNGRYNGVFGGQVGDIPMALDYTGEGKARAAIFRPSSGTWLFSTQHIILNPKPNIGRPAVMSFALGQNGDIPIPGFFSGSSIFLPRTWRPASASFTMYRGQSPWGMAGDTPLPTLRGK